MKVRVFTCTGYNFTSVNSRLNRRPFKSTLTFSLSLQTALIAFTVLIPETVRAALEYKLIIMGYIGLFVLYF